MNNIMNNITVIFHSRKKFYNGKSIYWYEFITDKEIDLELLIPSKFLRVPFTQFYEFGGTHDEAILDLTKCGFSNIIEGMEI